MENGEKRRIITGVGANEALEDLSGKHGVMVVAKSVYPTEKNESNEPKAA